MRRRIHTALAALLLPLAVRAQTGVLVVETTPAEALVYVGVGLGRAGVAPVALTLPAGDTPLVVRRAGFAPDERVVRVPAGDTLVVRLVLRRLYGQVAVEALPPGGRATVGDGQALSEPVPTGETDVTVTLADGRVVRGRAAVRPAVVTTLEFRPRQLSTPQLVRAVVVPGGAHIAGGQPALGAVLATAVGGGVAVAVASALAGRRAGDDVEVAYQVYLQATSEPASAERWAEVEAALERQRGHVRRANVAWAAAAVVHAAGLAHGLARHVFPPGLRVRASGTGVTARVAL